MTPYYADESVTLYHGDCRDVMAALPDASVDLILTDPPYNVTEKPLGLLGRLLGLHSRPGDVVLDPFAGSGTTLRAAVNAGRRAIGIEIDERYCELIVGRLAQGVLDFGGAA